MKDCTEARLRERILRKSKHNHAFTDWLELVTEILEIAVAVIVLIGFVLSVVPIVRDMPALLDSSNEYTFHIFLEHAFNLVIGIEFIRMLIKHTPGSALEVLLFAIARHMVLSDGRSPAFSRSASTCTCIPLSHTRTTHPSNGSAARQIKKRKSGRRTQGTRHESRFAWR